MDTLFFMSTLSDLSDLTSAPDSDSESSESATSDIQVDNDDASDSSNSTVYIAWSSSPRQHPSTPVHHTVALPSDDDGDFLDASSPVKGPSPLKQTKRRKKGAIRRWANHRDTAPNRNEKLQNAIKHLESEGLTVGDLTEYIFNPLGVADKNLRWKHFFMKPGRGSQLLTWWVSPYSCQSGRKEVEEFAISFVEEKVAAEATRDDVLRNEQVSKTSVTGFSFEALYEKLENTSAKMITRVISAIATSKRQIKKGISVARLRTKKI
ncbi:hypothetical protein CVT24_010454, partial [Panaeolus cyanescens]